MEKIMDYLKAKMDKSKNCEFNIHRLAKEFKHSEGDIITALKQLEESGRISIPGTSTSKSIAHVDNKFSPQRDNYRIVVMD